MIWPSMLTIHPVMTSLVLPVAERDNSLAETLFCTVHTAMPIKYSHCTPP